jgi:hypothetical protein
VKAELKEAKLGFWCIAGALCNVMNPLSIVSEVTAEIE